MLSIFRISQTTNNEYDSFDSAVVVAEPSDQAKTIHPNGRDAIPKPVDCWTHIGDWVNDPSLVHAEYIGQASASYKEPCVICASFNAG